MDYLAGTQIPVKHVQPVGVLLVDHEERRARVAGSLSNRVTYTALGDFVNIVAKAIDYEGEWPRIGGINGNTISTDDEIAIGEKIRGKYSRGTRLLSPLR